MNGCVCICIYVCVFDFVGFGELSGSLGFLDLCVCRFF